MEYPPQPGGRPCENITENNKIHETNVAIVLRFFLKVINVKYSLIIIYELSLQNYSANIIKEKI